MTWLLTDQTVINNGVVLRGAPTTTEIEPLTFYATIDVAVASVTVAGIAMNATC